jgi:crossover junction endodeoxyribonuclease RusA
MIELPFPAKILWPNGRGHHMKKHREFGKHKTWAYLALLADRTHCYESGRVSWSVTFYPKTRHAIDDDNARASLKAYQDGFAMALGVDDNLFSAPTIHWGEPVKHGKIVVTIGGDA